MTHAERVLRHYNPNCLVGTEAGLVCAIEDVVDPDGRIYRLEYDTTPDARHAIAYVRFNPWAAPGAGPNAGEEYSVGHVASDGYLCLGSRSERDVRQSPYTLEFTLRRSRYWVTAFSYFKEKGQFPQP